MQTATDDRTEMLKAAIADCFKAREAVTPTNVRAKLPADFFLDFDTGAPLADEIVFAEIQSTYAAAPRPAPMVEQTPDGRPLAAEPFPPHLPPSDHIPELPQAIAAVEHVEAAPVAEDESASHAAGAPGPTPQARLDAARVLEAELVGNQAALANAQRNARAAVADAVQAYQRIDPNRQTPEQVARSFIKTGQETRARRAQAPGPVAFVDLERRYQRGGDANAFARKMGHTLNRRGAYSQPGGVNYDPKRGAVPKPVEQSRGAIPALARRP